MYIYFLEAGSTLKFYFSNLNPFDKEIFAYTYLPYSYGLADFLLLPPQRLGYTFLKR